MPNVANIQGYEFSYDVDATKSAALHWDGRQYLDATFTCSADVELTKTPTFSLAKNWWVSYVQVILMDGIYLHYQDDSVYVVKPFAVTPKDMDVNQFKYISPNVTLFDVRPASTQPISLTNALTKTHQNALGMASAKGNKKATVRFSDSPALDIQKNYEEYSPLGVKTGRSASPGLTSPADPSVALKRIYGRTSFGLWLVVMMNPTMQAIPDMVQPIFEDLPSAPLGPQGPDDFFPLHYFEWDVDWTSQVNGHAITPTGEGMKLAKSISGKGVGAPRLDNSTPATGVMGIQKL